MARTVFLHIGLPKTGTTFIQTAMWHNRDVLRRRGFLYPGRLRMDHYRASQEVRGVPPARMGAHAGTWRRLVDELSRWDGDGLISHEFFSMATPKQARAAVSAFPGADVVVIVTVRPYVLQLPAVWQEALKMNSELSFDAFMKRALDGRPSHHGAWSWASQDIPAVLRRWSRAVPPSQFRVVTVPPPGGPPGVLWERWLEATGVDGAGLDLDVGIANTSLGAAQAALLHRVKPHLSGPLRKGTERHRWVRQYFGHEVLVPQQGARFQPRAEQAERLAARSRTAVETIRDGGYPVVGDLDDLLVTAPAGGPHPDDVSDAEIVDVAARAIEQMIRDVRVLTRQRDRLRGRTARRLRRKAGALVDGLTARARKAANR
jgi:hypothetical protein